MGGHLSLTNGCARLISFFAGEEGAWSSPQMCNLKITVVQRMVQKDITPKVMAGLSP